MSGGGDPGDRGEGAALDATVQATPSEKAAAQGRTLADGRVVADRYEVLRLIARGGMGEVYEVRDRLLGERVAMKTIRPEHAERPGTVERFRREIQLARQVTHPNVCRIFDVGVDGELFFFTMELLGGESLSARLARGRLAADEALPLARQMAGALDAAHEAGIIHRDFKPQNVMLVERGAVVTDFGVARAADDRGAAALTGGGDMIGTPLYMAPEQVAGRAVTPTADVYAFGATLYEMVTGAPPFQGPNALAIASARLTETPRPPIEIAPDLPVSWNRAILACLKREPEQRPKSAGAALRLLEEPVPRGRRRWVIAAGTAVMVTAAAALAITVGAGRSSKAPARADAVDPAAAARGREHFKRGNQLLEAGRYAEAADEYALAYEDLRSPKILLNLGTTFRGRGQHTLAVHFYRRFLEVAPDDPKREEIEQLIREIEGK